MKYNDRVSFGRCAWRGCPSNRPTKTYTPFFSLSLSPSLPQPFRKVYRKLPCASERYGKVEIPPPPFSLYRDNKFGYFSLNPGPESPRKRKAWAWYCVMVLVCSIALFLHFCLSLSCSLFPDPFVRLCSRERRAARRAAVFRKCPQQPRCRASRRGCGPRDVTRVKHFIFSGPGDPKRRQIENKGTRSR